jgi:hypothetical protein
VSRLTQGITLPHLNRSVIPEAVRWQVSRWRRTLRQTIHDLPCELRWTMMSPESLSRWTERRLGIGQYYWLFLLGCNNSGTTLLVRILESHPLIRTLPTEGQHCTKALPNSTRLGVGRVFSQRLDVFRWTEQSDPTPAERVRYDWAACYDPRPGILLEKSPPNTVRSRWLQRHFQPCRFLVIVRNPYAVCEGIRRRRAHSIEEAAMHWRRVHEILQEDMPYLERSLWLRYEDLCERFEEQCGCIEGFLELDVPFDRDVLAGSFNVHNMDGTPQPIQNFNDKSLQRLSPKEIEAINQITGVQMKQFGYEPL